MGSLKDKCNNYDLGPIADDQLIINSYDKFSVVLLFWYSERIKIEIYEKNSFSSANSDNGFSKY